MQAVKKSALSCTARAVLHSTFLPKLEHDSGEHSRYLCPSQFWIPYPLWFACPKDQVCVLTVRLFCWSSYCSKTLLLIHCGVIFWVSVYILIHHPNLKGRGWAVPQLFDAVLSLHGIQTLSLAFLCLLLLVWPWQLQCNRCLFLTCLSVWERLLRPQLQCQLWMVSKLFFQSLPPRSLA